MAEARAGRRALVAGALAALAACLLAPAFVAAPAGQRSGGARQLRSARLPEQSAPAAAAEGSRTSAVGAVAALALAGGALAASRGRQGARGHGVVACRAVKEDLDTMIAKSPVFVVSKAFCPFCKQVKAALDGMGATYEVMELQDAARQPLVDDVDAVQDYMQELTGARSVPRVFIGGKFVGGADDTIAKKASGELEKLLEGAGALGGAPAAPAASKEEFVLSDEAVAASDAAAAKAKVKVGDPIPAVNLDLGFPPDPFPIADFCKGKKVVLVGLPGAFTPT